MLLVPCLLLAIAPYLPAPKSIELTPVVAAKLRLIAFQAARCLTQRCY